MELCLNQKAKEDNLILRFIPYILIILASICACFILFYKGFPMGDDLHYHFSNIYDMYLDLKSGGIRYISSRLASGLGFGKNLFYSPLSHLSTCVLAILLEPLGVSLLNALKINLFLSVLVSGFIMYRFGMHLSKNKRIPALIQALVFVLYPYRYFDMICRIALAETYAFMFMPLFFMGLYDFIHIDDRKTGGMIPSLEIILGGSLLFLTHNITAIFSYFFGVIYLFFHVAKIYKLFKENKIYIIYALISMILLLGLASKTLFSAYSLYQTGLYNVSDPVRMWTSSEYLAKRNDFEWYSGLINLEYFTSFNSGITRKSAILDAAYFGALTIGIMLINSLILKADFMGKVSKIGNTLLLMALSIILSFVLLDRLEARLGVVVFVATYLFYLLDNNLKEAKLIDLVALGLVSFVFFLISMITYKMVMYGVVIIAILSYAIYYTHKKKKSIPFKKESNMDLWYLVFAHILTIILIVAGPVWYIMPSFLRTIQFPWRLFGFLSLFSSMISAVILKDISKRFVSLLGIFGASFLMVVSQAHAEKRIDYINSQAGTRHWNTEINNEWFGEYGAIGACREYFPYMYYYNDDYESKYENSLYDRVKTYINSKPYSKLMHNLKPQFLTGDGTVSMEGYGEDIKITISVSDDALVQIPLIYYPGYEITVQEGNDTYLVEPIEVDGLVSITLDKGDYFITLKYEGTKIMKLGKWYQYFSIYGVFLFMGFALIFDNKKRNLKENALY